MASIFRTTSNLGPIDRLGEIKAQIADLQEVADALAADLKAQGAGTYDGELFTATVAVVDERWSPDPKAIAAKLREAIGDDAFDRFAAANQKRTSGYTALKLASR